MQTAVAGSTPVAYRRAINAIRSSRSVEQIQVAVRYGALAAKDLPKRFSDHLIAVAELQCNRMGDDA